MTNYMGKTRMVKLFFYYIALRTEYVKSVKAAAMEYCNMYEYRKYKGSEWLNVKWDGYEFRMVVSGAENKAVALEEYRNTIDESRFVNRVVSYFDKDFVFLAHNKSKSLDCPDIAKRTAKTEIRKEEKGRDDIIYLDTETTGLDPTEDEILQISIVNDYGEILLDTYIKPEHHTEWKEAEAVNHITSEMVSNAPLQKDVALKICEILSNAKTAIAYNMAFDWHFIAELLCKHTSFSNKNIPILECCMIQFAEVYGEWDSCHEQYKWQKLSTAADYYQLRWHGKAHGALADALMCKDVWNCIQKYGRI